jgi:hypothetical protein
MKKETKNRERNRETTKRFGKEVAEAYDKSWKRFLNYPKIIYKIVKLANPKKEDPHKR